MGANRQLAGFGWRPCILSLQRAKELVDAAVQVICLLALSNNGSPAYDQVNAARLAKHAIPVFACTPDLFPDLMAAAIQKQDLNLWAAKSEVIVRK